MSTERVASEMTAWVELTDDPLTWPSEGQVVCMAHFVHDTSRWVLHGGQIDRKLRSRGAPVGFAMRRGHAWTIDDMHDAQSWWMPFPDPPRPS